MTAQMTAAVENDDISALLASLTEAEEQEAQAEVEAIAAAATNDDFDEAALLADLSSIGTPATAPAAVIEKPQMNAELEADLLADITSAASRAEAYEKQADGVAMGDTAAAPAASKPAKEKKARKARDPNAAPKAAKAPRTAVADLPEEVFTVATGVAADKAAMPTRRPLQVKVAEKFDNLFSALHASKEPSRYVVSAFKLLNAQKSVTSTDLVNVYKLEGLGDGTARSQTGQIMALFAATGVALRSSQTLALEADSAIAAKLRAILGL